jgi:predicted dehydrogenase
LTKERDSLPVPEIALAGAGRWGLKILRALVACGARVWVVDPSAQARSRARSEGASGACPDESGLPSFDAAVVAVPTRGHSAAVERLGSAGLPVFCEKPLTADAAEAAALARKFPGRLFVLDKWRYHPAVEALADIAAGRTLGPVRALRTRRVQPGISGYDVDPVWVLAPHELSIASEILGPLPPLAAARARFAGNEVVALEAEFGASSEFSFEAAADAPQRVREIVLECVDGTVSWSMADEHAIVVGGRQAGRRQVDSTPPLTREMQALLSSLAGGEPLKTDGLEGAASVLNLERARELAGVTRDGRRSR